MFTSLLMAVALLLGSYCFSAESKSEFEENESIFYVGQGNAYLLMHEPCRALESFQMASSLVESSEENCYIVSFLTLFGKIVAYDCLGLESQCKQSIGEIFLVLNQFQKDQMEEKQSFSEMDVEEDSSGNMFVRNFFYEIASLAPSVKVRDLLLFLVNDLTKEFIEGYGSEQDTSAWSLEEWEDF